MTLFTCPYCKERFSASESSEIIKKPGTKWWYLTSHNEKHSCPNCGNQIKFSGLYTIGAIIVLMFTLFELFDAKQGIGELGTIAVTVITVVACVLFIVRPKPCI